MEKKEEYALLIHLAERLGVDLNLKNYSVATSKNPARARTSNGDLEIAIRDWINDVFIETPRGPGIQIKLVDPNKSHFALAPKNAFFEISAYTPYSGDDHKVGDCKGEILNHDIYSIYVSREGLILDSSGLRRAAEIYEKNQKKR